MGLEAEDVSRAPSGAGRLELSNLTVKWPAGDLGQLVRVVQRHLDGIGARLGSCIEEKKGKALRHIPEFELENPNGGTGSSAVKVGGLAQAWFSGIVEWRNVLWRRFAQARDPEFSQVARQFSGLHKRSSIRSFASMSTSQEPPPQTDHKGLFQLAMTTDQVSRRLSGVPVYTVSNSQNEFVLISDITSQKSLGIFCFQHSDAESLLSQVRDREPSLGRGAKVVAVSLDKVYQLNTEGIAFRFLPDPRQVKNALEAKSKSGESRKAFNGVPVFQSDNLILRSNNKRFCPIFFCKEDLERALSRAFKQQQRVNPSLRAGTDMQVGSFEDVLKRMEANEMDSGWGDIVFIPPGIDAFTHLGKPVAQVSGRETVVA